MIIIIFIVFSKFLCNWTANKHKMAALLSFSFEINWMLHMNLLIIRLLCDDDMGIPA